MECRRVVELLSTHPASCIRSEDPAYQEVRDHLSQCGLCRVVFDAQMIEDLTIKAILTDIELPLQSEARLNGLLQHAARSANRRSLAKRLLVTCAIAIVAVVGALNWSDRRWKLQDVQASVMRDVLEESTAESAPSWTEDAGALPVSPNWQAFILDSQPRRHRLKHGFDASIYRFADSSSRVRGLLIVVPASQLKNPPATTHPASIEYRPLPCSSWQENGNVYVCVAQQGDLSRLLRSLYGATT